MKYFVLQTFRESPCDKSAPIAGLVLDKPIGGHTVFNSGELYQQAKAGQIWCKCIVTGREVQVRIFQNYHGKLVATTRPDGIQCNNLLSLPIAYPARSAGGVTYYSACPM